MDFGISMIVLGYLKYVRLLFLHVHVDVEL